MLVGDASGSCWTRNGRLGIDERAGDRRLGAELNDLAARPMVELELGYPTRSPDRWTSS